MTNPPQASVIVCTRNRGPVLARTLEAALDLASELSWELLVVDNGSTDGSLELAQRSQERHPDRVRLVSEPVVGLSAARNCGVRLARGELVLFLDDDALPVPGWIDAYASALEGPEVLSAGGPVVPDYQGELPTWVDAQFLPYLSVWDRGPEICDLRYNELPRGANVAYRREAFERVGEFDRRLGRAGGSLRSCEEIELGLRIERCGYRTLYVPAAGVRHRVEAGRLTVDWMARRFAAQGFSEAIIDWKHHGVAGLRSGRTRRRATLAHRRATERADSIRLRCELRDERAYFWGGFYAMAMVERWQPPRSVDVPR